MENQAILDFLKGTKKGTYIHLKKSKDLGEGISKLTEMRIRVGVAYANMAINEGKEIGSLPWGHWVDGLENLVIEHKGKYYLRITSSDPSNVENSNDVISTCYIKEGRPITKEEVLSVLEPSKIESKPNPIYNIKFENILELSHN